MDIILTLLSKKTIAPSIIILQFQPDKKIDFEAGQYLNLLIPGSTATIERSFSIASDPNQEAIELIVRIVNSGLASTFLKNLKPGDVIKAQGPGGLFTIRQLPVGLTFFSSGTGLAPIRSIILDTLRSKKQVPIFLCIAQNRGEEFLLKDEFDYLADNHINFQFEYSADPAKTALTKILKNSNDEFYICGGPIFVSEINETLIARGIQEHRIHLEKY